VTVANNCYGVVSGGYNSTVGLIASVANNCYGYCYSSGGSGTGIYATVVNNCYGYLSSSANYGDGIIANDINNSYGYASAPYSHGLNAGDLVTGSSGQGYGTGSYGIYAYVANTCVGSGTIGNSISHPINVF